MDLSSANAEAGVEALAAAKRLSGSAPERALRMLNRAISASTRQPVHATQEARTVALKDGTEKTASSAKSKKDNNNNENYSDDK